jgi:hypothetical protein
MLEISTQYGYQLLKRDQLDYESYPIILKVEYGKKHSEDPNTWEDALGEAYFSEWAI